MAELSSDKGNHEKLGIQLGVTIKSSIVPTFWSASFTTALPTTLEVLYPVARDVGSTRIKVIVCALASLTWLGSCFPNVRKLLVKDRVAVPSPFLQLIARLSAGLFLITARLHLFRRGGVGRGCIRTTFAAAACESSE